MSIFKLKPQRTESGLKYNLQRADRGWTTLVGQDATTDKQVPKSIAKLVDVYAAAVRTRANTLAGLPFEILSAGGNVIDTSSDYQNSVGWWPDPANFLRLTEEALVNAGRAYWRIIPNVLGTRQAGLQWMSFVFTAEKWDDNSQLEYFVHGAKGKQHEEVPPDEVLWFWYPDPYIETGPGTPPGVSALAAAEVLRHSDRYIAAFFERGAIKPTLLIIPEDTIPEEAERVSNWWRSVGSGVKNAWRAFTLRAKGLDVKVIGEGLESLENRDLTEVHQRAVLAALGVPSSMVFSDDANFATAQQHKKNFIEDVILPEARFIAQVLNERLFSPAGYTFRFTPEQMQIFQTEESEKAQSWALYVDRGGDPAVIAEALGLEIPPEAWTGAAMLADEAPPIEPGVSVRSVKKNERADLPEDYERWEAFTLKRWRPGKEMRSFESEDIDEADYAYMAQALTDAKDAADVLDAFKAVKTAARYRRALMAPARGLWAGEMDFFDFFDEMSRVVELGFTAAWNDALKSQGLKPDEITPEEQIALRQAIVKETQFIDRLGLFIQQNSRENGGKLRTITARINQWVGRYNEVNARALTMAQNDPKLEWVYDPAKENCSSCSRLHGKVKRSSWWNRNGILPAVAGASYLECQGYQCGCKLRPTNKPLSRGRMPGLP